MILHCSCRYKSWSSCIYLSILLLLRLGLYYRWTATLRPLLHLTWIYAASWSLIEHLIWVCAKLCPWPTCILLIEIRIGFRLLRVHHCLMGVCKSAWRRDRIPHVDILRVCVWEPFEPICKFWYRRQTIASLQVFCVGTSMTKVWWKLFLDF